jgi:hypothetical protein
MAINPNTEMDDDDDIIDWDVDELVPEKERTCRQCGCSENDPCVHPQFGPCWWAEDDLCSHCQNWPGQSTRPNSLIL